MALLYYAKSEDEIKKMGVANLRMAYNDLANNYNKMLDRDIIMCPSCGEFMNANTGFYYDENYATNRYPVCKKCLLKIVEQRKTKRDEPNETKESVQKVLRMMDKVYDDDFYNDCVKGCLDASKEKNRSSPFATYITAIQSLPNWKGLTWANSRFGSEDNDDPLINKTTIRKEIKKIFGYGFSNEDYAYLQEQYDDWRTRTQVDSKSQETYVTQICLQSLEIFKDRKAGRDVSNKLKTLDTLMSSANLQPKQNVSNAATDSLTFSQLIEKWEQEKPIPEPDPELCDVSGIGKKIRVWFGGWLANALGLDVPQSQEYLDEVAKYTVSKPEVREDGVDSSIYNKMFGVDS